MRMHGSRRRSQIEHRLAIKSSSNFAEAHKAFSITQRLRMWYYSFSLAGIK